MNNIDFSKFEIAIGVSFKDKGLLRNAFVHRSYVNENKELTHNERLEFLGDAVLELVVTEYLFSTYSDKAEGELTAIRAALVNTTTLSNTAKDLKMNDYLLLSRGETRDTGRARQFILANTFEALIGAIYLDQGYLGAKEFISKYILPLTKEIVEKKLWVDSKSYFQEKAQEHFSKTPTYSIVKEHGPDHDRHFLVGVYINEELIAEGDGMSKQEAEQEAARSALEIKGWSE